MFEWIIKLFGKYQGQSKINHGTFKGTYDIYYFLGKVYEIKVE
jgi:hypothetical protein